MSEPEPITLYRGGYTKIVHAPSQAAILEQHGWSRTPPAPSPAPPAEAAVGDDDATGVAVAGAADEDAGDDNKAAPQAKPAAKPGKAGKAK